MAYAPTDWQDGITPVDAAHMDKIEAELVRLGTAPAGADLSFDGDWVAGTYQDGDTVVKDGIVFMCVGGPTTVPPDASLWGTPGAAPPLPADTVVPAATRIIANKLLAGDAQPVYRFLGDGRQEWGPGGAAAPDVSLYRSGAGELTISGNLKASLFQVIYGRLSTRVGGPDQITVGDKGGDGATPTITFGPAGDTNLYRSAAGMLKTDTDLTVAGTITSLRGDGAGGFYFNPATQIGYPFYYRVASQANPIFSLDSAAKLSWGAGGAAATDTTLRREAAGFLGMSGIYCDGDVISGLGTGGGANRIALSTNGQIYFGSAYDTYLSRLSPGVLGVNGVPIGGGSVTVGTTLPASPTDGQEAILVDSLTAPTYQWRFKYMAGIADANKWIFIGGPAAHIVNGFLNGVNSMTYVDAGAVGPAFTVPRAGTYQVEMGCLSYNPASMGLRMWVAVKVGAAATSDANGFGVQANTSGNTAMFLNHGGVVVVGAAAADVLKLQYRSDYTASASHTVEKRWMRVTPVRVA